MELRALPEATLRIFIKLLVGVVLGERVMLRTGGDDEGELRVAFCDTWESGGIDFPREELVELGK
jgi:hypothetical protein